MQKRFETVLGLPEDRAKLMVMLQEMTASGAEAKLNDAVHKVTGRSGKTFETWAEENKEAFG